MNSILGPAPVLDFDGTIASLPVPWADLRSRLGVRRVDDLWCESRPAAWDIVRQAEEEAAGLASANPRLLAAISEVRGFAVLTNNAESSVRRFLDRHEAVSRRAVIIVGRETLGGPKSEFAVFERGLRRCLRATADQRGDQDAVYVGDMAYELEYARRLGVQAFDVGAV